MTDRYNALTVILEKDIREDDAEALLNAIRQLRGVLSVTGNVANLDNHIIEKRVKIELIKKLLDMLREEEKR